MTWRAGAHLARVGVLAALVAAAPAAAQQTWRVEQPVRAGRTGFMANRALTESSGVAVSRAHPGVLWTLNDSGNPPVLFATDTLGRDLAAIRVTGATNVDWETIRLGSCPAGTCLYIGDIGDNTERRTDVVLYRVPEPAPGHDSVTAPARALHVRYPDGPHDAEAMLVTPDGDLLIITTAGAVYGIPGTAWRDGNAVATARGVLPLPIDRGAGQLVTDAALAPDGHRAVVRTYVTLYFFTLDDGRLIPGTPPRACTVAGLEIQGEGIDWLSDRALVLTSEKAFAPASAVAVAVCAAASP